MTQIEGVISLVLKLDGSTSLSPSTRRLSCIGGMIFFLIFRRVCWLFRGLSSSGIISQLSLPLSATIACYISTRFAFFIKTAPI